MKLRISGLGRSAHFEARAHIAAGFARQVRKLGFAATGAGEGVLGGESLMAAALTGLRTGFALAGEHG